MHATTRMLTPGLYRACVLATFLGGIALTLLLDPIRWDFPDNLHYAAMASGTWRIGDAGLPVLEPFANRVLAPLLAGLLARSTGLDVMTAMAVINGAALILIGLVVAAYFERKTVPLSAALTVAAMPIFGTLALFAATVDALFVLVTIVALIAAFELRRTLTAPLALTALLLRESFIAYYPFLVVRDLLRGAWLQVAALIAVAVLAVTLIELAKPYETSNIHNMSGLAYLILKIPVNLIKNLLGITFWTNTKSWCVDPFLTFDVRWLPGLGDVKTVGICTPTPNRAINTLINFLCIFGIVPLLVARDGLRDAIPRTLRPTDDALDRLTAFWAAAFFFLLAPGLGSTESGSNFGRLFIYVVPCLVVLVPRLRCVAWGWWPLPATIAIGLAYRLALPGT